MLFGHLTQNDSVTDPYDEVVLKSGALIYGYNGIDIYSKKITLYGAKIQTVPGVIVLAATRNYTGTPGDEYDTFPGTLEIALRDDSQGNKSSLAGGAASLYFANLIIDSNDPVAKNLDIQDFIALEAAPGAAISVPSPKGTVDATNPVIAVNGLLVLRGANATYALSPYSMSAQTLLFADDARMINGQGSSGSGEPLVVGLDPADRDTYQGYANADPELVLMLSDGTIIKKAASTDSVPDAGYNCGGVPCTSSQYQEWLQSQRNPTDPGGSVALGDVAGPSVDSPSGETADDALFGGLTEPAPNAPAQAQVAERASGIVTSLVSEGIAVPEAEVQTFLSTLDEGTLSSDLLVLYVLSEFDNSGPITPNPRVVNASTTFELISVDMTDVKAALAPVLNWSPNGSVAASDAYSAVKEAVSIVASPQFVQAHYAKNAEMYANPPQTESALTGGAFGNPSDWKKVESDDAHNLGSSQGNVSYVYVGNDDRYKGYQYVFDASGNLVTDPANMGTYNVADPTTDGADHVWNDILPWILLGSSENDPTSPSQRLDAALAAFPQIAAEIGVEQLKLIVFNFQKMASPAGSPAQVGI
jgi:hypothetical protein